MAEVILHPSILSITHPEHNSWMDSQGAGNRLEAKRGESAGLYAPASGETGCKASRPSKRAAHGNLGPMDPQDLSSVSEHSSSQSDGTPSPVNQDSGRRESSQLQEQRAALPQAQLVRCLVRKPGHITYHPVKRPHCIPFCSFVEQDSQTTDSQVTAFFRALMRDLEARGVFDFHLQIGGYSHAAPAGFFVEVKFGDAFAGMGPRHVSPEDCIACQPGAEIFPGMTSQETYMVEYNSLHTRASFDAQGRPAFIVTPLRHVGSLDELEDAEVADLFRTAAALAKGEKLHSLRMVLNHGRYRNLPHLHLKMFIDEKLFDSARNRWDPDRTAAFEKLLELRPAKNPSLCKFFMRTGRCRYGSECRNLHSTEATRSLEVPT